MRTLLGAVGNLYSDADRCRVNALLWLTMGDGLEPEERFSFARNGPLFRMERRVILDFLFVIGRDRVWEYRPDQREYIERPLSAERSSSIATIIAKHFFTFVSRFPALAKIDSSLSFLGWKEVRTPSGNRRCAVIGIAAKDALWFEKLWVDPDTAFVWKSEMSRKAHKKDGTAKQRYLTTTIWTKVEIGEPPDPETFTFHPRKETNESKCSAGTREGVEERQMLPGQFPDAVVANRWLPRDDARNYLILGDPAVRLRVEDMAG